MFSTQSQQWWYKARCVLVTPASEPRPGASPFLTGCPRADSGANPGRGRGRALQGHGAGDGSGCFTVPAAGTWSRAWSEVEPGLRGGSGGAACSTAGSPAGGAGRRRAAEEAPPAPAPCAPRGPREMAAAETAWAAGAALGPFPGGNGSQVWLREKLGSAVFDGRALWHVQAGMGFVACLGQ